MTKVAALFVDPKGPYPKLLGLEMCWDETRDARTYAGPWPVVAHPPCHLWTNLAAVNFKRYGGEHNRPGNDGGMFKSALASVRKYGGVLEHPAFSNAWREFDLQRPESPGWAYAGSVYGCDTWVCEVWQSAYGHKARKRTWLYYVGPEPPSLDWSRKPGTHQIGFHDQRGKERNKPTISGRAASETPLAFAELLVRLAALSKPGEGKSE